ncbi:potassium transporter Kef [Sandarakinorhabdus cyanobacteriorum]|uniref:Potassium transporter Kef n=1 Tax=Sandarakinorhabdus cyanobacteriorum TaxID=1981098 RepID=A0A255YJA3_9SPHN|nr:cation:proton antiporter [Sandarakinorhabdus cyanobacteriorum]OYQ29268.1 potassium transporter Kef [Sandarakinorhabdus cyanobacteriorum]
MTTGVHANEDLLFSVLIQLIIMIGAARALNIVARRLGQPGAVGEIIAGLMLGPSLLGALAPDLSISLFGASPAPAITIISQIGLTLLMFQIGSEFEFGHLESPQHRKGAALIAAASVLVPLAGGLALGWITAPILAPGIDPTLYALFFGNALAITALPILGRILAQFGLTDKPVGVVAISAAAVNDVAGWVMLASISALAAARFSGGALALQLAGIGTLLVLARFVLAPLASRLVAAFPTTGGRIDPTLMAAMLALVFGLAICTYKLGIFAIFGGFLGGLIMHRHTGFVAAWKGQVGGFVLVFFLPVFFTYTGLRTNLLGLGPEDLSWLAVVLAVAILAKILPVYGAARLAGYTPAESAVLGSLMNTRALMELIVLNIGRDLGVIPPNVFTMLVVMAVVTTIMAGPLLKSLLPRTGHIIPRGVEA